MSLTWVLNRPSTPQIGDCWYDSYREQTYMWQGTTWMPLMVNPMPVPPFIPPTEEQLEKHPALKQSWEEFLVVRRLLGI